MRKIIDTVVILILCGILLFGCIYFVTLYVIAKEIDASGQLAVELSDMFKPAEKELTESYDDSDPVVKLFLADRDSALNDIIASDDVSNVRTEAVMFNTSMGVDLPSLEEYYLYNVRTDSGTAYTKSDEYLASIPAIKTTFFYEPDSCRYSVYMAGTDRRYTQSFYDNCSLSYDPAEHGRIFLIEKEAMSPSSAQKFIYYQLSTGITVKRSLALVSVYTIEGYSLDYTITKRFVETN